MHSPNVTHSFCPNKINCNALEWHDIYGTKETKGDLSQVYKIMTKKDVVYPAICFDSLANNNQTGGFQLVEILYQTRSKCIQV